MCFYLPHKNWRARLALNPAASNIWLCWVVALDCLAGLTIGVAFWSLDAITFIVIALAAIASFLAAFIFLPEAKRVHAIRVAAGNGVFLER
jgi:hypothetical protein